MRYTIRTLTALGLILGLGSGAMAKDYSYATFNAPTHVMVREMGTNWAAMVKEATGGEVSFEVFAGASLMPALSMLQGVRDGLVNAGHLAVPYYAADLPANYVAGELGFANPNYFALAFAYLDYAMHDPVANAEWRANNVIPVGAISTPNYFYVCKGKVTTLAEMQGKKVRSPGGAWGRFTTDIGMTAVAIPYNELYTSLERGAVDCAAMSTSDLTSGATVIDLVDSIVKVPLSPGYNSLNMAISESSWQGFTDEQRRAILDATAVAMAKTHVVYEAEVLAAEKAGLEKGMTITDMDAEMQTFYDDWNTKNLDVVIADAKGRGMEDPKAVLDAMQTYIDKWNGLLEGVARDDEATLVKIAKENLFDKVDEKTYGMD